MKLCAIEPRLRLERFPPPADLESGTVRSSGQYLLNLPNYREEKERERGGGLAETERERERERGVGRGRLQ